MGNKNGGTSIVVIDGVLTPIGRNAISGVNNQVVSEAKADNMYPSLSLIK